MRVLRRLAQLAEQAAEVGGAVRGVQARRIRKHPHAGAADRLRLRAQRGLWPREGGAVGSAAWQEAKEIYVKMLAPVAPHIAEELWTRHMGGPYSIHQQSWPKVDELAAKEDVIEIPVQVNGKVRDRITIQAEASEDEIKSAALASEIIQKHLEGREPKKVIVANKRLVSVVI